MRFIFNAQHNHVVNFKVSKTCRKIHLETYVIIVQFEKSIIKIPIAFNVPVKFGLNRCNQWLFRHVHIQIVKKIKFCNKHL